MNIFEDKEIRNILLKSFPKYFVNHNYEIIIYPPRNTYFILNGVETELDLKCKILEWLSREASESISRPSQKYHLQGINSFLGTEFTRDEMAEIYTYLGNACNHEKTIKFVESGYDLDLLAEEDGE